jgi:tRNA pseudouridine38-40 synthase
MKHRLKAIVEYDGTNYSGWQSQRSQNTVQDNIEKALKIIFKTDIRVIASGRTDAGVHANNQTLHFDSPEYDLPRLKRSMNGLLNGDIVVKNLAKTTNDFHARFSAKARKYHYYISEGVTAVYRNYSWQIYHPLNKTLLQKGAELYKSYRDFKSFCKSKSEVDHYNCHIYESRWLAKDNFLIYEITANRFLHGMVRALTGLLVALAKGDIHLREFKDIIENKDRALVPLTAPAKGLFLEKITY